MRLGILGPLEVVADDGTRLDPTAGRQRRLLLALLVWREQPVTVDRLVDLVWSDGALPKDPLGALRTYVTRLRAALDPGNLGRHSRILTAGPAHYVLHLDGHELDAERFERDVAQALEVLHDDPARALRWFEQGLARWRGAALIDVADEQWALPEAVRLEELRLTAYEHRLSCLIETGSHPEVLSELEGYVREHPLRERPHGLLMVALDRAGRSADASEVFRSFRQRLADEAGLDASDDLDNLHTRLLARSGATTFAETATVGVWDELPATRTELVGRQHDITALGDLLASHPVVTLTGVGGAGKTRLAIEVARRQRDAAGSVVFVQLEGITDADDVVDAVFGALHLPGLARAAAVDGLVRVLRSRACLLVLDNCEHVLDAVAALVDRLSATCPDLVVLTTTREPIGVDGERVYRLASLDAEASAALFRARAAAAGAALADDDEPLVRDICRRLDGIPLAIELAAARAAHMTLADIAEHLDDSFSLLTGGRRAVARQQTLEAAIGWSYDLLDEEEQLLLRAASVFVDGFTVPALAEVTGRSAGVTLDRVAGLVSKSLVEVAPADGRTRYRLLETVRLYGLDRLKEAGELAARRGRHAHHFLTRALRHRPAIRDLPPGGGERTMCRIRLDPIARGEEADLANHLVALDWLAGRGDLVGVGRLAARLGTVLGYRGFLDPDRRYLRRTDVAAALQQTPEQALYLLASALHASYFGDFSEILRFGADAMRLSEDRATRAAAIALTAQGSLAFDVERVPELVPLALQELPADARHARLLVRGQETLYLLRTGALAEAAERLQAHSAAGDVFAASELLLVLHVLREDERALALPVPRGAGREHTILWRYRWPLLRGMTSAAAGQPDESARHLLTAAAHIASLPVRLLDHDVLLGCAAAAAERGEHERALHLLIVAGRAFRSPASSVVFQYYRARMRQHVGERLEAAVTHAAGDVDAAHVLEQELEHLRALANPAE